MWQAGAGMQRSVQASVPLPPAAQAGEGARCKAYEGRVERCGAEQPPQVLDRGKHAS